MSITVDDNRAASRTTMRWELVGPERGAVRAASIDAPGPGQVLIRVAVNGLCASDLPVWRRGDGDEILGHEPVGEVIDTGPGVTIPAGTWVTGRIPASFAQHAIANIDDVVVIPAGLDPMGALGEPIGCVVEGFRRTRIGAGDRVAIIGLGFMGLLMTQLAAQSPAASLVAIDPRDDARAAAIRAGVDEAVAPDVLSDRLVGADDDDRHRVDVVIEASGTQAGLDLATRLVRSHGTISILGYHQGDRTVDMRAWNEKAIDVVNAHVRDRQLLREATRRGLELAARGGHGIDVSSLVTHRFALDQVDNAFRALASKPDGFIKAVIVIDR